MLACFAKFGRFCAFQSKTLFSVNRISNLSPLFLKFMSTALFDLTSLGHDMSIDVSHVDAFREPEFIFINKLFLKYGYDIRVAGGAVRDILMKKEPKDVDMATTATPSQMVAMFTKEEIRMLNRNGEAHGTVTVRLNDKTNYEITTLRIDTKTDGRHAEVSFTTDWQLDASRRDLTVNSMFIGVSFKEDPSNSASEVTVLGKLYDYFNGYDDLVHRRIRFVGEPSARIQEDYLRILRYFRFFARLARNPDEHDETTLKAIRDNSKGLVMVAGERIWTELKMIFLHSFAPSLVRHMSETGVITSCGLPSMPNFAEMDKLYQSGILSRDPIAATCVASVLHSLEELQTFNERVKLSTVEFNVVEFLVRWRDVLRKKDIIEYLRREYLLSTNQGVLKAVFPEAIRYLCQKKEIEYWLSWEAPRFPVSGIAVTSERSIKGKELGPVLLALRKIWVDSDCKLTAEELMSDEIFEMVSKIPIEEIEREPMVPVKRKRR
ncbi:unnamed protein product [Rodentolepis nana]|uniref:CCA tRNA nucleotidyltransferase 1, mitochondrial n=1 Tax=Rodentolepis nana TaxID=102285 RepID=A0A0R3T3S7_RODNA|nr:unnamed protein product [Rodentolepis nana]